MNRALVLLACLAIVATGLLWFLAQTDGNDTATAATSGAAPAAATPARETGEVAPPAEATSPAPRSPDIEGRDQAGSDEPAEEGAYVRVVRELDGTPLAETSLRVVGLGEPEVATGPPTLLRQSERETDADGSIDLSPFLEGKERVPTAIRLVTPGSDELELIPWSFPPSSLGKTPGRAFEVVARVRPRARVRGLVVDGSSGAPVPEYALHLRSWSERTEHEELDFELRQIALRSMGEGEWVVTDASGRFETNGTFPEGLMVFSTIAMDTTQSEHLIDADGAAIEGRYEVQTGPRILLAFDAPGSRTHRDFVAGLWRAPAELVRDDGILEFSSPWSPDGGTRTGLWGNAVAVQGDTTPWFRATQSNVEDSPLPTQVFVLSRDGKVFGHAPIEEFERHAFEPVYIPLTEAHSLEGRLVWPEGEPFVQQAELELYQEGEEDTHWRWLRRMHREPVTPFAFQNLSAGTYQLSVDAEGAVGTQTTHNVPASAPLRIALEREDLGEPAPLMGRIVTRSGAALDGEGGRAHLLRVALLSVSGGNSPPNSAVAWENGIGRFRFDAVYPGHYVTRLIWKRGGFPVPDSGRGRDLPLATGEELVLDVMDDGPTQVFEVRVIDPQAKGYLRVRLLYADETSDYQNVWFGNPDVSDQIPKPLEDGRLAVVKDIGPRPSDTRFEMKLEMDGHRSPELDGDAFAPPDHRGVRVAEIVPVPGWSAIVHVYEGENEDAVAPLEGIVLTFDGVATRKTDAEGFVYAEGHEQPRSVDVLTTGWAIVDRSSFADWGSVRASDGAFTVEDGRLTVHLKRVE